MSLRNKLWLGFGSLFLILLVVSCLSIVVFTRYSHALEKVFRENYDSAVYSDGMKESLDQLDAMAQRSIWEKPASSSIDVAEPEARFESNLGKQIGNVNLPGELEVTKHLADLWHQYQTHLRQFAAAPSGRADLYQQDLLPRFKELKRQAQQIADMNMSSMISADGHAKQTLMAVRNAMLVLIIAGTVLAAAVVWTAGTSILRPLGDLTQSARQIEEGNLDLNVTARSGDEIGKLAEAFNSMASRLREFKRIDHDRLTRTQQTTQLAIDSLPDVVFVIGPDDKVEISNNAAQSYFGIAPGKKVADLGLKWLEPLYAEVKDHQRAVTPHGYKSAVQLFVDGNERFLLPKAVPMLSPDHRQLGVTAILVDVTDLRHADEAKSNLVSTVSHELRTPLTSQRLVLGLLISSIGGQLSASHRRLLDVAKADGDRLYRTIEDLLSISRMESGRAHFVFRPASPRDIVSAAVDPLRQLFTDKGVHLTVHAPPDLPRVRTDTASINSALTNLISNALKFTPPDGAVAVSVEAVNDSVVFKVRDTGPGIPLEFRSRIFEKFFRVPAAAGPTGAGLGLSISREIAEAHGGSIFFECPAAGGTLFCLQLPRAE